MISALGFLITICILVVIHEFGHYIFARIFNVKVISFSIGFGPKLLKWQGKHNEWCISAIPLGGYVQMLDERESDVTEDQKLAAYNNKKPWQKLLIAFAGPLFNIIFAFFAYYALGIYGVYNLKATVEDINPTPLVKNINQIPINSTILTINGITINSWNEAEKIFAKQVKNLNVINLEFQNESQINKITLDLTKLKNNTQNYSLIALGIYPFKYLNKIGYTEPQSVAVEYGLREGDQIISINGVAITSWFQISTIIHNNPSKKLDFTVLRNKEKLSFVVIPESSYDDNGQIIGKVGIMPTLDSELLMQNSYIKKYTFFSSLIYATDACISAINSNITMLNMMVQGKMSWHNLGGPVSIAKASAGAMHQGVKAFVDLLALISLSIALMNLLPVPVLDGGHIMIYAIEWIIGKPISNTIQHMMFKIGLIFVLSLTVLALYNDFLKLLNW